MAGPGGEHFSGIFKQGVFSKCGENTGPAGMDVRFKVGTTIC